MSRLLLECGDTPRAGWININQSGGRADLYCDLLKLGNYFETGTVDEIDLTNLTEEQRQVGIDYWRSLLKPTGEIHGA